MLSHATACASIHEHALACATVCVSMLYIIINKYTDSSNSIISIRGHASAYSRMPTHPLALRTHADAHASPLHLREDTDVRRPPEDRFPEHITIRYDCPKRINKAMHNGACGRASHARPAEVNGTSLAVIMIV